MSIKYVFNPTTGNLDATDKVAFNGEVNAGSAASPSIFFTGDPNTGIYSPGADQVAISTGGSGRLFVDASGNVGVGTSPDQRLTIASAGSTTLNIYGQGRAAAFSVGVNATGALINEQNNLPLVFNTNNQERLRITSAGLVGIGTSSPAAKLHITDATGTAVELLRLETGWNSPSGNKSITWADGTNVLGRISVDYTSPAAKMRFGSLFNSGYQTSDLMTLTPTGLGIGTTSPAALLHIAKSSPPSIRLDNTSTNYWEISNDSNLIFDRGGTERMRLDASGRLLVGTSTAQGAYKLQVQDGEVFLRRSLSNAAINAAGIDLGMIDFGSQDGGVGAQILAEADAAWGTNDYPGRLVFSTTSDGQASPSPRVTIDNAGNIRFNSDSNSATANPGVKITSSTTIPEVRTVVNTADGGITNYSYYNTNATYNGYRFYVKADGGIANHSVNNVNLSDRNVKKDISPAAGTWNCIKEWEIVNYRYKDQPDDADLNLGVIAQQVAESCPEVITVFEEAKDDQPEKLGIKEQQMYWMAIKALQEAQVRIEALEAKVAALESA